MIAIACPFPPIRKKRAAAIPARIPRVNKISNIMQHSGQGMPQHL